MLAPNDNVIAQAVELRSTLGLQLEGVAIERAFAASSEAQVLQSWFDLAPDEVLGHAHEWHLVEPFSSRPVQMLSTLHAYQQNYELALQWIRAGLMTDPTDHGLMINLAYVQVLRREFVEASEVLRRLKGENSPGLEPFTLATEGLMAYQQGAFTAGDMYYNSAVALLNKFRRPEIAAYCLLNQAIAGADTEHPNSNVITQRAKDALKNNLSPDSAMLIKIRSNLQIDAGVNVEKGERRLSQWVFDPANNTLTERSGVTRVGAKAVVFKSELK